MEPTGNKSTELERRVSARASVGADNLEVDDEYALAGMVADGFRPTDSGASTGQPAPPLRSLTHIIVPAPADENPPLPRPSRPSSTSKPYFPGYSIKARDDPAGLPTRQFTNHSTSSAPYVPIDEAPYSGPSRPTHPYGLYRQTFRSRTASMATSSTQPLSFSDPTDGGPARPSHPYGLYPQGTNDFGSDALAPTSIPLGFRGLPDQYERRVGLDGEDTGEIIGPYGHTEQLPPYTRYPDEACVRAERAPESIADVAHGEAANVPHALTIPSSTTATIPGAGGIGLATSNPEFEPPDEPASPRSRHSTRTFASEDSARRLRVDDEGVSEKGKPPKKWQIWMRRKACGVIPYWAICLTGMIFLVMAVILGAVVGTLLGKQKEEMPWEPLFDTLPIPTPPDLQPLPTGTFDMPFPTKQAANQCFQNPTFSQAWNCDLVMSGLQLTVTSQGDGYLASLDCNRSLTLQNNVYAYGEQPPLIQEPVALELVSDLFEASRGPAWFKFLSFNKTVIVPEGLLRSPGSQQKVRHLASIHERITNLKRKGIAQRGEKPWVCNWPGTFLELFIYAQQNSSFANWPGPSSKSSSSTTHSTLFPSSSTTTTPPQSQALTTSVNGPYPSLQPSEAEDDSETDRTASLATKYRSYYPRVLAAHSRETSTTCTSSSSTTSTSNSTEPNPVFTTSTSDTSIPTLTSTPTPTNLFGPIDTGNNGFPPPPPSYPRVIKLEERRDWTQGAPLARCTQVEIQGPGEAAKVLLDGQGRPIVIEIVETDDFEPLSSDYSSYGGAGSSAPVRARGVEVARRDSGSDNVPPDMSPCGCLWFST